jgi:putative transposase
MAYVKIWLHCVWGTKNRTPFLTKKILSDLIGHIRTNAKEKGIYIDTLNGHREHIHCIISLSPDQTLAKVIQLIKGESSFWLNKNKLTRYRFEWAVEYYGVSVSESELNKVRIYIKNQDVHHSQSTWEDECNEMMITYGFVKFPG